MSATRPSLSLVIASDIRAFRHEGVSYATHPAGVYDSFAALAQNFRSAVVVSREATVSNVAAGAPASAGPLEGPGLCHVPVPNYNSWAGLIRHLPATARVAWKTLEEQSVAFVRLPEPLSILIATIAILRRRQLIVNLVSNPFSMRAGKSSRFVLRPILIACTRLLISRADGVIYVTRWQLQEAFPAPEGTPVLARSNARISEVASAPRALPQHRAIRLLTVGTNTGLAKGQDVLLDAVDMLVDAGIDVSLDLLGGGDSTRWIDHRIAELGLVERCRNHGHVDSEAVRDAITSADIFCLPSRSEGLPRSMIEALAEGVPGIGSNEGGIPELLPASQILERRDAESLARAIRRLIASPSSYWLASKDALVTAREILEGTRPQVMHDFLSQALRNG